MTADNLLQFLRQPQDLQRVSYQELKTLALEYPFCPHVHQLLLFKSRLSEHKDYTADLGRTAAHSVDRRYLRLRLEELDAALAAVPEEVFELKPVAEIEQQLSVRKEPNAVELSPNALRSRVIPAANDRADQPAAPEAMPAPASIPRPKRRPLAAHTSDDAPGDVPQPLQKDAFRTWSRRQTFLHHSVPVSALNEETMRTEAPDLQAPTMIETPVIQSDTSDVNELAQKSVEENQSVASETLAILLARQGHTDKAIEMYERLRLLFPEKSAYFAARIENLQK